MYQNSLNGLFFWPTLWLEGQSSKLGRVQEQDICSQSSCCQMFPKLISERTP